MGGLCFMCSPICDGCINFPDNCTACKQGDTLQSLPNNMFGCSRPLNCGDPCLTCNANGSCATCPLGGYLFNGGCLKCPYPSFNCTSNNASNASQVTI